MSIGNKANFIRILLLVLLLGLFFLVPACNKQSNSLSGTVTIGGTAKEGVTISLSGDGSATTTTDSSGHYSFNDVEDGTYTITPTLPSTSTGAGYIFTPWTRTAYMNSGSEGTGFDFNAILPDQVSTSTHTLFIKSDGTVLAWGLNDKGQLGNNTTSLIANPSAVQVLGEGGVGILSDIIAVAAGNGFSIALKSDGTIWAWGDNTYGQLGDGTTTARLTPVQVTGLSGTFVTISAGGSHALAIRSDGTLWAWGDNSSGQLGNSSVAATSSSIPVQASISNIKYVSAGFDHTMALDNNGSVWTWGNNSNGQLGNATQTNSSAPVLAVPGSSVRIAAGNKCSVVLRYTTSHLTGSIVTWGKNSDGQLGIGTITDSYSPLTIANFSDIANISAGYNHVVISKNDGTVWAWGNNSSGQLGNNSYVASTSPIQTSTVTGIVHLSAGNGDTVAYKNDGTVWAWGDNTYGQLGDLTNPHLVPIAVTVP
jgi:alpha-tubulin suppressor-like RCC1 family protein